MSRYTAEHFYPKDDISYYGQSFTDRVHEVLNTKLTEAILQSNEKDIVIHFSDFYEQDTGDDVFISIRKDMTIEPLVRCKDCKYYNEEEGMCNDLMAYGRSWLTNDYCSYGERREDE